MFLADLESILTVCLIISLIVILILWYLKGYDGKFNLKRSLYKIPQNLSTLDVGYIVKGEVKDKDVNSLVLYLASKNYLRIEEIKDSFQLVKLKEYRKKDEVKVFFDELFKDRDTVVEDELFNSFYKVTDEIKNYKNDLSHVHNLYFYNNSVTIMIADLIVITNLFFITTIVYLETLGNEVNYGLIFLFMIFYLITYLPIRGMNSLTKFISRMIMLLCLFFVLVVGFGLTKNILILNLLINIIIVMLMNLVILIMPKRNIIGRKYFEQIKRFKNSINDLDEKKLKELLKENKNYVFDIFPYVYTLGITKNLIDIYTKVDDKLPKYVKMKDEKDVRKNFRFLKQVAGNLARRPGDEHY